MKRTASLLVVSTLLASTALAGDPCKKWKEKKDAFGVTKTLDTGDYKLVKSPEGAWSFTFGVNASGGYGGFGVQSQELVPAGTQVDFVLDGGEKVSLNTSSVAGPKQYSIMGVMVSHYDLQFTLTPEQLAAVVAKPITAYRIMKGAEAWLSDETKKGDATKFQASAVCATSM